MIVNFTTRSGSCYQVNSKEMTWERLGVGEESGKIRITKGKLAAWPTILVGQPCTIQDLTSVLLDVHLVVTSSVVAVEDVTDEVAPNVRTD